jgi:predicted nucleic acid-binding protein
MAEHLFVDTAFLVARFNRGDANHAAAMGFLEDLLRPEAPAYRLVLSD